MAEILDALISGDPTLDHYEALELFRAARDVAERCRELLAWLNRGLLEGCGRRDEPSE